MAARLYLQRFDDAQVLTALYANPWCQSAAMKPVHNSAGSEDRALEWLWLSCLKTRENKPQEATQAFQPLVSQDLEQALPVHRAEPLAPLVIEYRPEQASHLTDKVDSYLLSAFREPLLYTRAGGFCRIAKVPPGTVHGVTHKTEHIGIVPVTQAHIRDILTRYIGWQSFDARKKGTKAIPCPQDVVQFLYHRGNGMTVQRPLVGVIEAPTLRENGSILNVPGYDKDTGLYLHGLTVMMPENPTREDAVTALRLLKQPFKDFPFPTEADRAVVLSAVLTGLVRPTLKSSPMFLFDAPKMGSGKTLLARVIGNIVLGSVPANSPWTKDVEETEKRLFSILMSGTQMVVFDNVDVPMQSAALCTILTEGIFRSRVLGESREAQLATNCLWVATGNGVRVRGDLSTRVLRCTVDPQMEYPEFRNFGVNLDQWVPAHRRQLVAAALIVMRAYTVAGRPLAGKLSPKTFGRFEQWSSVVREALVWAGVHDPMESLESIYADDETRHEMSGVLYLWLRALGEEWYPVAEIKRKLKARRLEGNPAAQEVHEFFRDTFPARQADDFSNPTLGVWLRDRAGRIEGSMRLEKTTGTKPRWRVKHLRPFG